MHQYLQIYLIYFHLLWSGLGRFEFLEQHVTDKIAIQFFLSNRTVALSRETIFSVSSILLLVGSCCLTLPSNNLPHLFTKFFFNTSAMGPWRTFQTESYLPSLLTQSSQFNFCGTLLSFVRFSVSNTRHFSTLLSTMVKALPWPWFISISWYKHHSIYSLSRWTRVQKNYVKQQQINQLRCLLQSDTKYYNIYVRIYTTQQLQPQQQWPTLTYSLQEMADEHLHNYY